MPYPVLVLAYRKPGTTLEQFKAHCKGRDEPLVRELAGAAFLVSRT